MKLIRSYLTKHPCFTAGEKIRVKGLMLHSVGCPRQDAASFVREWNDENYDRACVHAFIDGTDGSVWQTLPWNHRGWHCGSPGNGDYIGVEMCEPANLQYDSDFTFTCPDQETARAVARRTWDAAVELFAYLCRRFDLDPLEDGVIISHWEGFQRGVATDHQDPEHFWGGLGLDTELGFTMDRFRQSVAEALTGAKPLYIGCHLSSTGGFEAMGKAALSIKANTFAFFTRNPRGGKAKDIDPDDARKLRDILREHRFGPLVAHAPYTLNPCSATAKTREFAHMAMAGDMDRMEYLPGNYYNFHPGSHVGQGSEKGIEMIAALLNEVIRPQQSTTILLETMVGKGTEIGGRFEELAEIISRVDRDDKIGVCLDTCHISDGGYDVINDLDGVLDEFDRVIGLSRLKALHINDSKNPVGARKDRHACIGEGCIGLDPILDVINHPKLMGLPCILETPQESLTGYGREIALLRGVHYDE